MSHSEPSSLKSEIEGNSTSSEPTNLKEQETITSQDSSSETKETKTDNPLLRNLEKSLLESVPIEDQVIEVLMLIYDPEIPVSIYELGLIYDVSIEENKIVKVKMTLTSPACPVAGSLPGEVEQRILRLKGVEKVYVELVWDPPWNATMMSEAAQLTLGLF